MLKNKDQDLKQLARFAKALAHPTRLEIIRLLKEKNFCFTGDLVDLFPIAQSTVSQHLKELKDAGLIKGEVNPPKTKYCLDLDNWEKVKSLFIALFEEDLSDRSC